MYSIEFYLEAATVWMFEICNTIHKWQNIFMDVLLEAHKMKPTIGSVADVPNGSEVNLIVSPHSLGSNTIWC